MSSAVIFPVYVQRMPNQPAEVYIFNSLANAQAFQATLSKQPQSPGQLVGIGTGGVAAALTTNSLAALP